MKSARDSLQDDITLVETLRFVVPLWIHELRTCTPDQRLARAQRCARVVGTQGDALQFKSSYASGRRSTAQAFNHLAEGLACAAYRPGGVTFAGMHWCVDSRHVGTYHVAPCDAAVSERPTP